MLTAALLLALQEEPVRIERVVRAAYPIRTDEDGHRWFGTDNSRTYLYGEDAVADGFHRTVELELAWDDPADFAVLSSSWFDAGGESLGGSTHTTEDRTAGHYRCVVILDSKRVREGLHGRAVYGPRIPSGEPRRIDIEAPMGAPVGLDHEGAALTIKSADFKVRDNGSVTFELETAVPEERAYQFVFSIAEEAINTGSFGATTWSEGGQHRTKLNYETKFRVEPVETMVAVGFSGTCKLNVGGTEIDIGSVAWEEGADGVRRLVVKSTCAAEFDDLGMSIEGHSPTFSSGGGSAWTHKFESVPADAKNVSVRLVRKEFEPTAEQRAVTVEVRHRDVKVVTFERIALP